MLYPLFVSLLIVISILALSIWFYKRQQRVHRVQRLRGVVRLVTTESEIDRKRQRVLQDTLKKCWTEEGLLELATIYKRGIYGLWSPNPHAADTLCRHLVLHGASPDIRTDSMNLLYERYPNDIDCRGPVIPISHTDTMLIRKPRGSRPLRVMQKTPIEETQEPDQIRVPVRSDPQNSHQHSVVVSSRNALSALPQTTDSDIINVIESYIGSDCDPLIGDETKAKALHALDTITSFESEQFNGISEKQALARVWNTPHNRDLLIHQLASSIENGLPVCHTGKMTRIASTLDNGQSVIPMYAVKSDLLQKASSIRESYLSSSSESEIEDYMENDDSVLKEKMKRDFLKDASFYSTDKGYDSHVMHSVIDDIVEHGF